MNTLNNEWIKLYKSKKMLILLIAVITVLFIMIAGHQLDKYETKNEQSISQEDYYQANKDEVAYLLESQGHSKKDLETTINKNEVYYQNSIPYGGYETGAYYLFEEISNGLFLALLLPFSIFLIAIEAIIGEKNRGSLNFMLVSPVNRTKLVLAKLASITTAILLAGLVYTLLHFIYITSQYGFSGWTDPVVITVFKPQLIPIWQAIIYSIPGAFFTVFTFVVIGLFLSVIFQNYSGAFMGFLVIFLLRASSSLYLGKFPFTEYLPFLNLQVNSFLFSDPPTEVYGISFIFSLVSSILTAIILLYLLIKFFNERDLY